MADMEAKVLLDLSEDTVTAATLAQGYTAHDSTGAAVTGTWNSKNTQMVVQFEEVKNTSAQGLTTTLTCERDGIYTVSAAGRKSSSSLSAYLYLSVNGSLKEDYKTISSTDGAAISWEHIELESGDVVGLSFRTSSSSYCYYNYCLALQEE